LATQHLLDLGHATVWHVSGPVQWREAAVRQEGWHDTLVRAGRDAPPAVAGDWSAQSGYEAGRLLARVPDLTAVFVGNDHMALGLMHALAERERRIPQDISIVGFDDIPEAAHLTPPLTTLRQDFTALGRAAVAELLAQLNNHPPVASPGPIVPELVIRSSTAPAPA
jgi:LacI family transcriptional regulator